MSSCQDGCDLTPNQETVVDNESTCGQNDFHQLPSVTVRDARTLSISSATSKTSDCRNSSSESYSPFGSPESSPNSSLRSSSSSSSDMMELGRRGSNRSSPTNMGDKGRSEVHLELDALESGVSQMRDKFEDLSSNNNNLHFSSPTKDKLRYNRRSLVRSSSSACSSISENMEDACSSEESDADRNSSSSSSSSSPRNKPPLQRSNAIRGDDNIQPSPRSLSPISPVEELETYSGIKTVVRRPKKSQNGGSSPSWRWSVMGVGTGDYDAVTKASYKGRHPPPVSTSTPTGSSNHGNGHAPVLRRSSVGLSSTSTLVSPRSNKLSTEFRRLSLQMDMPWRDPNERLVQFADWLIKRTEELLERSARARQKTYELLRLARNRQKDQIVY